MEGWVLPGDDGFKPIVGQRILRGACLSDTTFGPFISGCRDDFDFTLLFEETILTIVPAACFILFGALRYTTLHKQPKIHGGSSQVLMFTKLVSSQYNANMLAETTADKNQTGYIGLAVVRLAIIVALAIGVPLDDSIESVRFAAAVVSLVAVFVMGSLSYLEYLKAQRTSLLLSSFLLVSFITEATRIRTVWLVFGHITYTVLFATSTALTGVMVVLEAIPKRSWSPSAWNTISPEETSGFYSLAFLTWVNPLVRLGYRKILDNDDLYPLDSQLSSDTVSRQFQISWQEKPRSRGRSLLATLFKSLIWSLLLPVPSRVAMIVFMFCQPFFIQAFVEYLQSDPDLTASTSSTGKSLITASIVIYIGIGLSTTSFNYLNNRAVSRVRTALVTAIFEHALTLNPSQLDTSVLTLMSTDVDRIQNGFRPLHDIWANLLEAVLAAYLLFRLLGPAFLAPILIVALCIAGTITVGSFTGTRMAAWTSRTESRVNLTNAVVSSIKPLKIAGLAGAIAEMLQKSRARELRAGNAFRLAVVFSITNAFLPRFLSPAAMFATAVAGPKQQQQLGMAEVFASLSFLGLLTFPLSQLFQKFAWFVSAMACLKRVQDFLDREEREEYRKFEKETPASTAVSFHNVHIGWTKDKWQLTELNLCIPKSQLTIVTGSVAAGKSTLCRALLGEAANVEGTIVMHQLRAAQIGYCDQTAFLVNGSIRSNIIGSGPFKGSLYDEVLEATLLKPDLRSLPNSDKTEVGSGGVTLSGGQKQRVALARALYLEAKMYILDDFTAGLDRETANEVVRRLFGPGGYLRHRKATVVWCTHSVHFLSLAEHIIALGPEGRVIHEGSPDTVLQDRQLTLSLENDTNEKQNGHQEGDLAKDQSLKTVQNPNNKSDKSDSRALNGTEVYIHYFSSFGTPLLLTCAVLAVGFGFFANSTTVWLKFWADNSFSIPGSPTYINAFYLGIFTTLCLLSLLTLSLYVATVVIAMATISGTTLHTRAVHALLAAPLYFLTKTDQGVLVNFFSQDMNLIDTVLPPMLMNALALFALSIGQAVVIAIGTPAIALAYPCLIVALYLVTRYYLRTSRQLRLLELEEKSPLYTQFADAVRGIATLRALDWRDSWIAQNRALCDASQRPLYLLGALSLWLSLVMRMVVAGLAIGVTVLATTRKSLAGGGGGAGFVGAGFVALMEFGGMVNSVIACWVELEMSLGAVKRLKEFGQSAGREGKSGEQLRPGEAWPQKGEILLDGVDASYEEERYKDDQDEPALALRGVAMRVASGEKVAIVGRTGSGKSSLILLLLRLLDPTAQTAGNLTIDGLSLQQIHRDTLRRRIIAMPQDMVFLAAGESFKEALDPYSLATGGECQAALETVGLLDTIKEAGGLHAGIGKDSLSLGQKQLFSLAITVLRAQMREKQGALQGVLLLDEVTSNVDRETETKIMDVIRDVFRRYTVVAVTHSLESVIGFDRVVVMASGRIVQEGTPDELLKDRERADL